MRQPVVVQPTVNENQVLYALNGGGGFVVSILMLKGHCAAAPMFPSRFHMPVIQIQKAAPAHVRDCGVRVLSTFIPMIYTSIGHRCAWNLEY